MPNKPYNSNIQQNLEIVRDLLYAQDEIRMLVARAGSVGRIAVGRAQKQHHFLTTREGQAQCNAGTTAALLLADRNSGVTRETGVQAKILVLFSVLVCQQGFIRSTAGIRLVRVRRL